MTSPADPSRGARPWALRILVAEDNELNVAVLKALLSGRGYAAEFVGDCRCALARAAEGHFDLMLLDLHMPEMDGFEVVRGIREHEATTGGRLRIIALTARSSTRDRDRCLAAGMDDFLSKPIEADALWTAIDRVVEGLPAGAGRGAPLLDARAILRTCGGQAAIFEGLCEVFRQSLPGHLVQIRSALGERDLSRLREGAHRLYGTLGAFSTIAGDVALTLEDAAAGEDEKTCSELVDHLESMCADLIEETRRLTFDALRP
jgi:two-component system, sensor histidine kinase and response regulator